MLRTMVTKEKLVKYYIHYAGWNKNWDEWVPENRVLKYNESNVQRQKDIFSQHSPAAGKKKAAPKGKKAESAVVPKDGGVSSGGSESRASTPSKEVVATSTPVVAPTTTTSNRASRGKRPATPTINSSNTSTSASANKESETIKEVAKKDEESSVKDDEPANKKKRGRSSSQTREKPSGSGVANSAVPPPQALTPTPTNTGAGSSSASVTPRLDSGVESEEGFLAKVEVKIKIPDELKMCLADDWDAITRQHKLVDIPAKITVQDIVDQYLVFKKSAKATNNTKEVAINDVLNGIVEYFNVMLGSQLLYKFERQQYAEILQQHPDTPLSKLYGAFHLLRLFVKLGTMLGFSALDEKSMQMLLLHLHDFLKFLDKNSATYFTMSNFVNVSPEYHRITQ